MTCKNMTTRWGSQEHLESMRVALLAAKKQCRTTVDTQAFETYLTQITSDDRVLEVAALSATIGDNLQEALAAFVLRLPYAPPSPLAA